jgi:hypothetical protein
MTRDDENGDLAGATPADGLDELHLAAARARRSLLEAPSIIGWVRAQVTPAMGGSQDGMPRAASKTAPLPLRADAVDDSDDAFARILYWVAYWSGLYEEQAPSAVQAHWRVQGETVGFRAGVTAEGASGLVSIATTWLLTRQDRILLHEDARTYLDDVADIVWQLHQRYPTAPRAARGVLDRPCPVCDRFAFGADWPDHSDAQWPDQPPVDDFTLRCSFCEYSETSESFIRSGRVRELLHELREEHADPKSEWWTIRQAVTELDVTRRTLERYIADGQLPTYTAGGTLHVSSEELLDLWRRKRMRQRKILTDYWDARRAEQAETDTPRSA